MEDETSSANDDEVFVYMGGDMVVPNNAVRVRVHPSVAVIPENAFSARGKLETVELCDGLLEIGEYAFNNCATLTNMKLPSTVKRINKWAFAWCSFVTIHLPDGIESIGQRALCRNKLTKVRLPYSTKIISYRIFSGCESMFSIEFNQGSQKIESQAFNLCHTLRNLVIPFNAKVGGQAFDGCIDLLQLFDTQAQIINALKQRFDNLPIHNMIYYHSYNNLTPEQLSAATDMRSGQSRSLRSKLDPSGNQQDCLGMTPLHVLACSTVQNIELYKVLIEKYPDNLIAEDRWGALPLLYVVWGRAPNDIIQFLIECYSSRYPNYEFNWSKMIETLGKASALAPTHNLLDLQKESFTEQSINWNQVLDQLAVFQCIENCNTTSIQLYRFLVKYSSTARINAIGLKVLRDDVNHAIETLQIVHMALGMGNTRKNFLATIRRKLAMNEAEYHTLKEVATILELALWKNKMKDCSQGKTRHNKKMRIEESDIRKQCRISCGAGIVIERVITYLLPEVETFQSDDSSGGSSGGESGSDDE